jgi:dsRNA-specific ribonuclease
VELARGQGKSKKSAESEAALVALTKLRAEIQQKSESAQKVEMSKASDE